MSGERGSASAAGGDAYSEALKVHDPAELQEIYALRAAVWHATGGVAQAAFPEGRWHDADDPGAHHWIVRDGAGRLVAAARLTMHATLAEVPEAEEYLRYGLRSDGPVAAPARIVVAPSAQGAGLGRRLLDAQDEAIRVLGAKTAVRQASPAMLRLLAHRGWRIVGPATIDPRFPGVEFHVAVLELDRDERATPTS